MIKELHVPTKEQLCIKKIYLLSIGTVPTNCSPYKFSPIVWVIIFLPQILFSWKGVKNNNDKEKKKEICIDQSEDFMKDSKSLYETRIFPDITFEVSGEEIPAHKAILASRSNYFMKMFTSI